MRLATDGDPESDIRVPASHALLARGEAVRHCWSQGAAHSVAVAADPQDGTGRRHHAGAAGLSRETRSRTLSRDQSWIGGWLDEIERWFRWVLGGLFPPRVRWG